MTPETARALSAINRTFYDDCASAFAVTRTRAWSGFEHIIPRGKPSLRVLDVGCGNGRFAHTVLSRRHLSPGEPHIAHYVGLDGSEPLLQLARGARLPFPAHFQQHDVLQPLPRCGPGAWSGEPAKFDLIVVFGLLHHIPGRSQRRALIEQLLPSLATDGRLVLSFFRYERSPRIMKRLQLPLVAAPFDLEAGDHLIPFGDTGRLRYCHRFDDAELAELATLPATRLVDRFTPVQGSDTLNDYLILEAAPAGPQGLPGAQTR